MRTRAEVIQAIAMALAVVAASANLTEESVSIVQHELVVLQAELSEVDAYWTKDAAEAAAALKADQEKQEAEIREKLGRM